MTVHITNAAGPHAGVDAPASGAERLLWLTEQLCRGSPSTVALTHLRLEGPVDAETLRIAIEAVRRRHPALRTGFAARAGQLWRRVYEAPAPLRIQPLPDGTDRMAAVALLSAEPYDLAAGDVLRVGLAREDDGSDLYLACHHVAVDGYSEVVLARDLAIAYDRTLAGCRLVPAELTRMVPRPLDAGRRAELIRYWRGALSGVLNLPPVARPQNHRELLADKVVELRLPIPAATALALRRAARAAAVPVFATLLCAAGRALAELAEAADFCVGTPVSTRRPGQEAEIGCELTVLPVRLRQLAADDAVARIWKTVVDALDNAELPLPDIIACHPPTDHSRMPLYQALVAYQNWPRPVHHAGPLRLHTLPASPCGPQGEVLVEFYDLGPEQLTAAVQAPSGGGWAARLPHLVATMSHELNRLAAPDVPDSGGRS